jgi:hypothetical protein
VRTNAFALLGVGALVHAVTSGALVTGEYMDKGWTRSDRDAVETGEPAMIWASSTECALNAAHLLHETLEPVR